MEKTCSIAQKKIFPVFCKLIMSVNLTHRVRTLQICVDIAQNLILSIHLAFVLPFALFCAKNVSYVVKMLARDIRNFRWLGKVPLSYTPLHLENCFVRAIVKSNDKKKSSFEPARAFCCPIRWWRWQLGHYCMRRLDKGHQLLRFLNWAKNHFENCILPLTVVVVGECLCEFYPDWPSVCDHPSAQNGCLINKHEIVQWLLWQRQVLASMQSDSLCELLTRGEKICNPMNSSPLKLEKHSLISMFEGGVCH